VPSCANTDILTTKARLEWGFEGYITSDWCVAWALCGMTLSCETLALCSNSVAPPALRTLMRTCSVCLLVLFACLPGHRGCSDAVSNVINPHHYTNTSDETCAVVLQAGMVRPLP
jgi:hypothetical protein